jgi:hypothetical protein
MKVKLTKTVIKRLRPASSEFTVSDTATKHLGIRIRPTGKMLYIYVARKDGRLKKITIGNVRTMSLDAARAAAEDITNNGWKEDTAPPRPILSSWVDDVWWPQVALARPCHPAAHQY